MKLVSRTFIIACLSMSVITASAQFSGLGGLFGGNKTDSTTHTSSGGGLGDLLDAVGVGSESLGGTGDVLSSTLGNVVEGVIGGGKEITVADIEGTWAYKAPSCKFLSENFLESAGGELVAVQVVEKVAPIYEKLGFSADSYSFTFDNAGKYVMNYKKLPLSGNITKGEKKGYFTLDFIKVGTYALATTPVYIELHGDKMLLLFEADKFINLFRSVVGYLGIDTLNSVFQLVDMYDGVLIGFELSRK